MVISLWILFVVSNLYFCINKCSLTCILTKIIKLGKLVYFSIKLLTYFIYVKNRIQLIQRNKIFSTIQVFTSFNSVFGQCGQKWLSLYVHNSGSSLYIISMSSIIIRKILQKILLSITFGNYDTQVILRNYFCLENYNVHYLIKNKTLISQITHT